MKLPKHRWQASPIAASHPLPPSFLWPCSVLWAGAPGNQDGPPTTREGKAPASALESECSLRAVGAGGKGRGRGNRERGNHVWRRNVLLKSPSWKKQLHFEILLPTLGTSSCMLQLLVAMIRDSLRGLAADEKSVSPWYNLCQHTIS